MQLALKVNVETYRGTLQGVPRLVDILRRHQANATFCFALGPDQTGRMPKRDGSSVAKTGETISRLKRYGFKSLMFGNTLPGPDIGKRCVSILTGTASAGFETAIHGWNVARWQAGVDRADGVWTEIEMRRAHERYAEIFGVDAHGHAAPGWQMNPHALRLTQRLGYQWASDCRGTHPFIPVWNAEIVRCPQLPTTLPALAELVGFDNVSAENAHMALAAHSEQTRDRACSDPACRVGRLALFRQLRATTHRPARTRLRTGVARTNARHAEHQRTTTP